MKTVLDVCCGERSFWFNKNNPAALYLDMRKEDSQAFGKRFLVVPDMLADFRQLPFPDASFPLVVFDPPHQRWNGPDSIMRRKYGALGPDWQEDLRRGFAECFRVLRPLGTLVFKWSEAQIKLKNVLSLTPEQPLFGSRHGRGTIWLVFQKEERA